jgi:hypothetical protein
MCNQRTVSTLDHVLPQSYYPLFVVTPDNLIPACIDCNKLKLHTIPTSDRNQFLHPYYDNIEAIEWLAAEIIPTIPVGIRYYVNTSASVNPVLLQRIEFHFNKLELAKLYASHAAEELSIIEPRYQKLHAIGGERLVKESLQEEWSNRSKNVNSWHTVMYRALSGDRWYHNNF